MYQATDDVQQLLKDHRSGHSEFQIDYFIIANGNLTPYGRYKQCLREIAKRVSALEGGEIAGEAAADTERELSRFVKLAKECQDVIGQLTDEKREELDRAEWIQKLKRMAMLDVFVSGFPSRQTLELLVSVPSEVRVAVLQSVQQLQIAAKSGADHVALIESAVTS